MAVLALAASIYALLRIDAGRDRHEELKDEVRALSASRDLLRAEINNITSRERRARRELEGKVQGLADLPTQVEQLGGSLEELRGRSEGPERAWSRAEAMFLLELAHRRLVFDRDLATAVVALESADARLASLREPALAPVRQQIAKDLQSLRNVQQPDLTGVLARLATLEEQVSNLPVRGVVVTDREPPNRRTSEREPDDDLLRRTLARLISVRRVDERTGAIVSVQEERVRRQHLALLLFSARQAVLRHDATVYRNSLGSARQWLDTHFDLQTPAAQRALQEVQSLEPVNIDPELPDISASVRALQRTLPGEAVE